jgi:HSP20 family protein
MRGLIRHRPQMNWGLMDMRDELNRMFGDFGFNNEENERFWAPSVDIIEENDKLAIIAEIPGVDKKDVKISLQDNVLTIEGEKGRMTEEKQEKLYSCERSYGKFSRSFTLPSKVDATKIEATYKDGILTVTLPKAEEAKPHQVNIN